MHMRARHSLPTLAELVLLHLPEATREVSTRTRKKTARHTSLIQACAKSFPNFSDLTGTVRRVQIVGNRICGSKNTVLTGNKLQLQCATATARADVYLARKLTTETRNRLALHGGARPCLGPSAPGARRGCGEGPA